MEGTVKCSLSVGNKFKDPSEISQKLQRLGCPFTWDMSTDSFDVQDALNLSERRKLWPNALTSPIVRSFEYAKRGDLLYALEVIQECILKEKSFVMHTSENRYDSEEEEEEEVDFKTEEIAQKENGKKSGDAPQENRLLEKYQAFQIAYNHVLVSIECFILYKLKRFQESEEKIREIVSIEDMSPESLQELYLLKSSVVQAYGYTGKKQALRILESALQEFPKSLCLQRMFGKMLGRVRRIEDNAAPPDLREIMAFENSLKESYKHKFAVYVARLYRENARSFRLLRGRRCNDNLVDKFNSKALQLYRKVYDDPNRGYKFTVGCAEGFTRLPPKWRDLEKAECCIKEALCQCKEDPYLNHIAGTYFTITGHLQRAKHYLALATNGMTSNYGACINLILVKQRSLPQYDPVPDLESLLQHIKDRPYVEEILCYLGAYVYFQMNDFKKAFGYWIQVIEQNVESKKLVNAFCRLLGVPSQFSVNKVVVHELRLKINKGTYTAKEKIILDKMLALRPKLKASSFGENRFNRGYLGNPRHPWQASSGSRLNSKEENLRQSEEDCGEGSGWKHHDVLPNSQSSHWRTSRQSSQKGSRGHRSGGGKERGNSQRNADGSTSVVPEESRSRSFTYRGEKPSTSHKK